jgi:hypothetical protein
MKYTLNFSLGLDRQDAYVIYNSERFTESPILISIPEIVDSFEHFLRAFEAVNSVESGALNQVAVSADLNRFADTAYICQSRALNEAALDRFCADLTNYFQHCCLRVPAEGLLAEETNLYVSGLREVIELRNYLAKYTRSPKKIYQNGYLYVAVV